jgi:MFS family permease
MSARSLRAHQTVTLSLLFLAGVVNFLDRSSLSVASTTVAAELHLSFSQMGLLLSAFAGAYGLSQLPLISLVEQLGTRSVLGAGLTIWSGAQLLTGLVRGFPMFIAFRILLGIGESPFYPAGVHSVREWFGKESRGKATGLMNSSQSFGLALAPPFLTVLMLHVGWRAMFMILGLAGLVVAALWIAFHRSRGATEFRQESNAVATQGNPFSSLMGRIRELISQRAAWGMMIGFSGVVYTNWLYTAWTPGYLQTERHVSLAKSGWLAAIPFLGGAAGMLTSGFVSDAFARRGYKLTTIHRGQLVTGMLLSALSTVVVVNASSTATAVAGITGALFFIHFAGTSGWGYAQAICPSRLVASMSALQNFAGFVVASFAPYLTGWIVDRTHSFALGFVICATVTLIGAISYATLAAPDGMNLSDAALLPEA